MSHDFLRDRENALENSFFFKKDKELLERMKQTAERSMEKAALQTASGISDDALLDRLIEAGISATTAASLALVPLVVVAWADGEVQPKEREAILQGADEAGMRQGDAAYELLNSWLEERPDDSLLQIWKDYVRALSQQMSPESLLRLKEDIIIRIHQIAKVAGGILGLAKVDVSEKQAMKDIESAFDPE